MFNIFHRLDPKELEEAVLEYLVRHERHDLITVMINNNCRFSITREGELLCQTQKSPPAQSEEE
jgi:hypothetical protein